MAKKVTLADLSRETGFSQASISMILARRPDVSFSEKTVETVREAARKLGYIPPGHRPADLLGAKTIVVVCPFVLNHYYTAVVQSLQASAAGLGYSVFVCATYNSPEEEARLLRLLAESDASGVIFVMLPQSRPLARKLCRALPVVIIADQEGKWPAPFMELHNYEAGSLVARHLAELGHKNIICVSTPLSSSPPSRAKRYEGLKDTWQRLCPEGSLRLFTDFANPAMARDNIQLERYLGQKITSAALEGEASHSTAFVGINDMLAYGIMDVLLDLGKTIPGEFSVCGCDNDFASDLPGVRLTSVEHFMARNAREAFSLLHRQITEEHSSPEIYPLKNIHPELVIRASTGAPRILS